jgi:hypothetical protein
MMNHIKADTIYHVLIYDGDTATQVYDLGVTLGRDIEDMFVGRGALSADVPVCQNGCCVNLDGIGVWVGAVFKLCEVQTAPDNMYDVESRILLKAMGGNAGVGSA